MGCLTRVDGWRKHLQYPKGLPPGPVNPVRPPPPPGGPVPPGLTGGIAI